MADTTVLMGNGGTERINILALDNGDGTYSLATRDGGAGFASARGVAGEAFTSADQSGSAAAVTDAPTSGEKIVVDDLIVSVDTAMTITFSEETSGDVLLVWYAPANSVIQVTPRGKLKLAVADKKLMVQTSAAGNISVTATYHSEA